MMSCSRVSMVVAVLLALSTPAQAQFFSVCRRADESELAQNVAAHDEHTRRMMKKFRHGRYDNRPMPKAATRRLLRGVTGWLSDPSQQGTAILFYAHSKKRGRLCSWLLRPGRVTGHVADVTEEELRALPDRVTKALGVAALSAARAPRLRGARVPVAESSRPGDPPETGRGALTAAAELLLPEPISMRLTAADVDTLVVLPLFGVERVPYAALPMAGGLASDKLSIFVAPGFGSLTRADRRKHRRGAITTALVVGDPAGPRDERWEFPALPGARAEAEAVARLFGATPLVGGEATEARIGEVLAAEPRPSLVYLATHAIADAENPRDGSFLLTAGGRWTAAEIGRIERLASPAPLVVMSACQTGLGKGFEVGTIGLAQAWRHAGAADVVMSLWSVDDRATRELMVEFVQAARTQRPDKALQHAMAAVRRERPSPVHWAGFTVFGVP